MSQMIVFIPLFLLYEIGVIISSRVYKKEMQKDRNW